MVPNIVLCFMSEVHTVFLEGVFTASLGISLQWKLSMLLSLHRVQVWAWMVSIFIFKIWWCNSFSSLLNLTFRHWNVANFYGFIVLIWLVDIIGVLSSCLYSMSYRIFNKQQCGPLNLDESVFYLEDFVDFSGINNILWHFICLKLLFYAWWDCMF